MIGSGPSGFYATEALLEHDSALRVDIIDKLPTPTGLVRFGVAPDHQKTKLITKVFERIAHNDRVRFLGNIGIGSDLSLETLRKAYSAVIVAHGAMAPRPLAFPGSDLPGVMSAGALTTWYNGHPLSRQPRLSADTHTVAIYGLGNVSLDISRMFMLGPQALMGPDIAEATLALLRQMSVQRIVIIGRGGLERAKFSAPELREAAKIQGWRPILATAGLSDRDHALLRGETIAGDPRAQQNIEIFKEFSRQSSGAGRQLEFRFGAMIETAKGADHLSSIVLRDHSGNAELDAQLLVLSLGQVTEKIEGLPIDADRGTVPNNGGRVLTLEGNPIPGLYVVGWAKRGSTGTIGSNRPCSRETVASLVKDGFAGLVSSNHRALCEQVYRAKAVVWDGWKRIDAEETARGHAAGRPRIKITRLNELLATAEDDAQVAPTERARQNAV